MFSGLVTDIGVVVDITKKKCGMKITIKSHHIFTRDDIGCSISHDGCCLTLVDIVDSRHIYLPQDLKNDNNGSFYIVEVSDETLQCTILADWLPGTKIHIERALRVGSELGGHFVAGHVDCQATIASIIPKDDNYVVAFSISTVFSHYVVPKGSVAVNGVSLTINQCADAMFYVNIIPYTYENTAFHLYQVHQKVNIEFDMLAKYVAAMIQKVPLKNEKSWK